MHINRIIKMYFFSQKIPSYYRLGNAIKCMLKLCSIIKHVVLKHILSLHKAITINITIHIIQLRKKLVSINYFINDHLEMHILY